MSDRFWVVRPSERSRLGLDVRARDSGHDPAGVELKGLDVECCLVATHGLLLEIGQPLGLRLASGAVLNGFVRDVADREARIRFDYPLAPMVVQAIRAQHAGCLRDEPDVDLAGRRTAA